MNKSPLRWDRRQVVGVTQWGPSGPVDVVEPLAVWNHGQVVGEGQGSGNHARPVPPPDTSGGFSGFGATWDGSGLRWATGYRSHRADIVAISDFGEREVKKVA